MSKKRVLFVCIHNSARSQMAAAYLRAIGGSRFEADSAGLEPGRLNPLAVEAMRRDGIDISGAATQLPHLPGVTNRLNWSFDDPSSFTGPEQARIAKTIAVRDAIRDQVERFVREEADSPSFGRATRG